MATPPLTDRSLIFVTGKGGVGKTTIAAGLAQMLANDNKRVLACEIDAKGDLSAAFEIAPAKFKPTVISDHLEVMSMDTEASLKEYLRLHLKIPVVGKIGPVAKAFDFLATAAPGVREILTIGKLCWEVREQHYDALVVDASATGHIIGQLAAPQAINDLVKVGLIRSQSDWMLEILSDPAKTGLVIVTTPEEMPVLETIQLSASVRAETTVDLAAIVVNRLLPERFGPREEPVFEALATTAGTKRLSKEVGSDTSAIVAAARLATTMRRGRTVQLEALRSGVPGVPLILVPELFQRTDGLRATNQIATHLAEELLP